jgi:hypothetical protein
LNWYVGVEKPAADGPAADGPAADGAAGGTAASAELGGFQNIQCVDQIFSQLLFYSSKSTFHYLHSITRMFIIVIMLL